MLKLSLCTVGFLLFAATLAQSADAVGFRETELYKDNPRPIHVSMWYPTSSKANPTIVGENRAFYGVSVIKDAPPSDEALRPLVVLSHGYSGTWRNLSWLAEELAKQGYIVAAPDHPGTTAFNMDPAQAAILWERPRDLSRVIDALTADATLAGKVDGDRIAAIGHSLGGWTVAALAGAHFDTKRFETECKANISPRACALKNELGLERKELGRGDDLRVRGSQRSANQIQN